MLSRTTRSKLTGDGAGHEVNRDIRPVFLGHYRNREGERENGCSGEGHEAVRDHESPPRDERRSFPRAVSLTSDAEARSKVRDRLSDRAPYHHIIGETGRCVQGKHPPRHHPRNVPRLHRDASCHSIAVGRQDGKPGPGLMTLGKISPGARQGHVDWRPANHPRPAISDRDGEAHRGRPAPDTSARANGRSWMPHA